MPNLSSHTPLTASYSFPSRLFLLLLFSLRPVTHVPLPHSAFSTLPCLSASICIFFPISIHCFVSLPGSVSVHLSLRASLHQVQGSQTFLLCVHTLLTAQKPLCLTLRVHCWDSYMKCSLEMRFSCSCKKGSSPPPRHSTRHDYCFLRARLMLGSAPALEEFRRVRKQEGGCFLRVL